MSEYYAYRTGITCPIHIEHTEWGSFITKGISPLNFVERAYALGQLQPTYPLPMKRYHCISEVEPHCQSIGLAQCDYCAWPNHPATCKCETCRYWGT